MKLIKKLSLFVLLNLLFLFSNLFASSNNSYSIFGVYINYNLSNGLVTKVETHFLTNLSNDSGEIYKKVIQFYINTTNYKLKRTNWTQVGLIVWKDNYFPTMLFQVFPIGQYTSIQATGCKHGHCKTVVKTVGTAAYATVIWSCYNYSFYQFKGEPDLRRCKIATISYIMPFIYGSGAATKNNIHLYFYQENNFGNVNLFLNSSAALGYSILDFIYKLSEGNPSLYYNINKEYFFNYLAKDLFNKSGLSFNEVYAISGGGFDFSDLIPIIAIGAIGIAVAYFSGALSALASSSLLGPVAIVFAAIALFTLSTCGEGGSTEAHYDYQHNYFYYRLSNTCDSNFCKRTTYNESNQLVGQGFVTAPKGSYYFNVPDDTLEAIKWTYHWILQANLICYSGNCTEFKNYVNTINNYIESGKFLGMGEVWATYLGLLRLAKVYKVYFNNTITDTKTGTCTRRDCDSLKKSMLIKGYNCSFSPITYGLWRRYKYTCKLNVSGNVASYLTERINDIKYVSSKSVNYGGTTYLGAIDLSAYSYFAMTSKLIITNFRELFSPLISEGIVENRLGVDNNGPYLLDKNGNKHYLIEKVEIGNKTYYLPNLILIRQPLIGETKVS